MAVEKRATNRGPAAAAENRRALLDAARRLFAEHGYQVPLSTVAREAGVGQGTLYRHFPTRLDLAFAIFEDNYAELERIASEDAAPERFLHLWQRIIEQTLESAAFVEVAVAARREVADTTLSNRLEQLLRGPLQRAQAAGLVTPSLTVSDLQLIHRMIYGVIVTATDPTQVRASVQRALTTIDPSLSWSTPATGDHEAASTDA